MNRSNTVVGISLLAAFALVATAGVACAEDLSLTFQSHRVTLIARDVTLSTILDRWARIGGTVVLNGDAIQGGPVTLQLIDVPEREALDILLRGQDGYIVAERADPTDDASLIDRIQVVRTNGAPARAALPVAAPAPLAFEPPIETPAAAFVAPPYVSVGGFVTQGIMPPRPADTPSGTRRPGEATAQLPALYRPGTAPSTRPGEAPAPQVVTPISRGPMSPEQQEELRRQAQP